jgi:hypothetical protein
MGTATFRFFERHRSPPRAGFVACSSLLTSLGDQELHLVATLSPVAEVRVDPGPALHPALTPMTPHERDPFVERNERKIRAPATAGISAPHKSSADG